ncbi:MAG: dihydrofolate reductase family protein [Tetrasphaera sp.]|nr:dihydrofolate reductase family protein [Tetrasphaera sp.]
MPARFVYWMNVSLDLKIERRANEQGGGDWLRIGESLHRDFNERAGTLSMMVQGRRIYETMEGFWPTARENAGLPDYLREYGTIWTDIPKILVSRTRTTAGHNTEIYGDDAMEQLAALRAGGEGDIGVGGASLASQLVTSGLLDELVLYVHPVVLGEGRPLFDEGTPSVECDVLEQRSFDGGVTLHRYAVRTRQ